MIFFPVRDQPTVAASLKLPDPSLFFHCKIIGHIPTNWSENSQTCCGLVRNVIFCMPGCSVNCNKMIFISDNGYPVISLIKLFKI